MKYTSEYILKLQIHQHSLLTRKVFFRHNFQHCSSSLYRLDHLIIFIFKYSLSSSLLRLQVSFIFFIFFVFFIFKSSSKSSSSSSILHHGIWIIMTTGSSLLDHHHCIIIKYGSSLDLDHHHRCYLRMVLSLDSSRHRKFYRANPFSC